MLSKLWTPNAGVVLHGALKLLLVVLHFNELHGVHLQVLHGVQEADVSRASPCQLQQSQ